MTDIRLRVLARDFVIMTEQREWADLIAQLWKPFIEPSAHGDAVELRVGNDDGRYSLVTPDAEHLEDDPWLIADELRHAIVDAALESADDMVDLHAAALTRDGAGLLLAGATGTGKTTMSMALVERGWTIMSDDVAPLRVDDGFVIPFPKPIGLRDVPTWERLRDSWEPPAWPVHPRGALQVPLEAIGAIGTRSVPPSALVLLRFDRNSSTRLKPVSPATAIAECGQFTRKMTPSSLHVLTTSLGRSKCARLVYSSTAEGCDALNDWLFRKGS